MKCSSKSIRSFVSGGSWLLLLTVPLYGGLWMMASASSTLNPSYLTPLEVDRRIAQRKIGDLRYYNGDMHRASFALPNFVRDLVAAA